MTIQGLVDSGMFAIVNEGEERFREISTVFCCDLLSIAMGRAPAGCAWVTVMGNMNTLAVAALADAACIIMAEGVGYAGRILHRRHGTAIGWVYLPDNRHGAEL